MAAGAPRLLVYRIVTDGGWAPNVANGVLTLTICKPRIRQRAQVGDYVLAFVALSTQKKTKKNNVNRLYSMAYLFEVERKIPMAEYFDWCEKEAPGKIPAGFENVGNCQLGRSGEYIAGPHSPEQVEHDKEGCFALVSRNFAAWTSKSPRLMTEAERVALGLTNVEKMSKGMRNYFGQDLNAEKIAVLERIMNERSNGRRDSGAGAASANAAPNRKKTCKAGKGKPKANGTCEGENNA